MAEHNGLSKQPVVTTSGDKAMADEDSLDEEIPDYPEGFIGVQQAYEDIQQIFAAVARDYPEFMKDDDAKETPEGAGDQKKLISQSPKAGGEAEAGNKNLPELAFPMKKTRLDLPQRIEKSKVQLENKSRLGRVAKLDSSSSPQIDKLQTKTSLEKLGVKPELSNIVTKFVKSYQKNNPRLLEASEPLKIESAPLIGQKSDETSVSTETKSRKVKASNVKLGVEEDIQHDTFANEFIEATGKEFDTTVFTGMYEIKRLSEYVSSIDASEGTRGFSDPIGSTDGNGIGHGSSLKLIYNAPIWHHQENLYKTLSRLPILRSLVLDDSKIKWLRELGSMLPNLMTLSVMRCGLKSLDGTFGLPNLENLFAADNLISDPSPISVLQNIRFVDLSNNHISELKMFTFLKTCHALTCIKLMENEVCKCQNFHAELKRLIPTLREIRPRDLELQNFEFFDLCAEFPEDDGDNFRRVPAQPSTAYSSSDSTCLTDSHGKGEELNAQEMCTVGGWREEERRLRNICSPARIDYKKRHVKSIPYTVDEMDALLEELESSTTALPPTIQLTEVLPPPPKDPAATPPKPKKIHSVPRRKKREGASVTHSNSTSHH